jgi:signal transduction histidine kinase
MDVYPQDFNAVRHIERGDDVYWFLHDKAVLRNGNQIGWLRVLLSSNLYDASLRKFEVLWVGLLVFSLILAVLGGMVISGRALKPLKDITRTAREIGAGDLTKRLMHKGNRDEVGELARAFNEMADSLEMAFAREKQLTSDVSHELRTPLAVITANAENAEQEDSLDSYRCANVVVLQKSRQLQRMISQILMFAREHEHEDVMQLEEVNLRRALLDLAAEAAEWAEDKSITVETDVPDDLMIQADQMLLTRLFLNLLDNAVKYGREGGRIKVKALRAGEMAVASVCDNGDGISEEDLPHIFKRFYRADKARSGAGAGLGLSFAEMIVRLHHGKISVHSTPGVETCFVVELPFVRKQRETGKYFRSA